MTPTWLRFILKLVMESAPRLQLPGGPQPLPGAPLPQALSQCVPDTRRWSRNCGRLPNPNPHFSALLLGDDAQDFVPTGLPNNKRAHECLGKEEGHRGLGGCFWDLPPLQGWPGGALSSTGVGELPSKGRGVYFPSVSGNMLKLALSLETQEMDWDRRKEGVCVNRA